MNRYDLPIVALVAALTVPTSQAQERSNAAAQNELEELVVTGTRLSRKADYVSISPIVTVDQSAIEATGVPTVELVLNRLPQFVPTDTATSNNSGDGVATANLRGLQPNRTLVLLDGRRIVPSGGSNEVDINLIPPQLIEKIEVVTGGASSTYGSDAIAGVVNFILRRDFSGVQATTRYGATERGDGESFDASLLFGGNFAEGRGNAVAAFSYADRDSVFKSDRDFSAETGASGTLPQGTADAVGSNLPTQAAVDSVFSSYGIAPGTVLNNSGLSFNSDATLFFRGANYRGPTTAAYSNIPITGTFNSTADTYLIVPLERYTAFGRITYQLTSSVEVFGQFNFSEYEGNPLLGGTPAAGNPSTSAGNGFLVPLSNPFIPADLLTIAASRPNPNAPLLVRKRFADVGPRFRVNDYSVNQFTFGARGSLWNDWTWDLHASRGKVDRTETLNNAISHRAMRTLLEAPDGGASLCEGGYNLFGENGISAECQAYVSRISTAAFENDQHIGELIAQGTLFRLPAGEVRAAIGVSYRDESFSRVPDATSSERDIVSNPADPSLDQNTQALISGHSPTSVSGSTNTEELFAEVSVPLLREVPGIYELTVDLGARQSRYDTVGTVSTYKGGLDWRLVPSLRLRGGYSRAVRAPNVTELFSPISLGNVQIGAPGSLGSGDPCDVAGAYRTGPDGAAIRQLCLDQGIPDSLIDSFTLLNTFVQQTTGGNPNLKEETADTYSFGVVWTPTADLSVSADVYSIELEDAVGSINGSRMLINCFNNPTGGPTNPNFSNDNFFCNTIERDSSTGEIIDVNAVRTNLGYIETAGVDFQVDWRFDLKNTYGSIGVNLVGTYLDKFDVLPVLGGVVEERVGSVSNSVGSNYSEWRTLMSVDYNNGPLTAGLSWQRIEGVEDFNAGGRAAPTIDYFDANVLWNVGEKLSIRAGVLNLTDKQPPEYSSQIEAGTDPSTYDVLGRRYFLSATVTF